MSTIDADIEKGLRRIAYLRKERRIILCVSLAAMGGMFFMLQPSPGETTAIPYVGGVITIIGLAIVFNAVRFAFVKCPKCHGSFNGYTYLLGIRRGNPLECTKCGLSLGALPEFKPTYKSGGQD